MLYVMDQVCAPILNARSWTLETQMTSSQPLTSFLEIKKYQEDLLLGNGSFTFSLIISETPISLLLTSIMTLFQI